MEIDVNPAANTGRCCVPKNEIVSDDGPGTIATNSTAKNSTTSSDPHSFQARIGSSAGNLDGRSFRTAVNPGGICEPVAFREIAFGAIESAIKPHAGLERHKLRVDAAGDPDLIAR